MPTDAERIRELTRIGILPEYAQDIVEQGDTLSAQTPEEAARITARDRARARVFTQFSTLFPDWLRGMFEAGDAADFETV